MNLKKWTSECDTQLRALWADPRLNKTAIAARLGFSGGQIGRAATALKLPQRPKKTVTFDPDDLRALWDDREYAMEDLAGEFAVTIRTVQLVAAMMGLPPRHDQRPGRVEPEMLRRLWHDDALTIDHIAERMGVSSATVIRAAQTQGYPSRYEMKHGRAVRQFRNVVDRERFAAAWLDPGATVEDLAAMFEVSTTTIYETAGHFGLPPRREVRRMGQVQSPLRFVQDTPGHAPECLRPADADILQSKGRYSRLADIAARHQMGLAEVQRRFHQLRAAG